MIVLIDNKEQLPLQFSHTYIEGTERIHLDCGDYGVKYKDGYVPPIFFERKSIPDLFGTLGGDYKRFKKEVLRSKENHSQLIIIIEGTVTDILKGTKYSTIDGIRILRTLLSIWNRYNIASIYCKNREEASIFITEFYLAHARLRNLRNFDA